MNVAVFDRDPVPDPLINVVLTGFDGIVVNANVPSFWAVNTPVLLTRLITLIDPVCFSGNPPTI